MGRRRGEVGGAGHLLAQRGEHAATLRRRCTRCLHQVERVVFEHNHPRLAALNVSVGEHQHPRAHVINAQPREPPDHLLPALRDHTHELLAIATSARLSLDLLSRCSLLYLRLGLLTGKLISGSHLRLRLSEGHLGRVCCCLCLRLGLCLGFRSGLHLSSSGLSLGH